MNYSNNKFLYFCMRLMMKLNHLFPDRTYLKLLYFFAMGKRLHLNAPKTFNEKIQWLKLEQRDPLLTTLVDKIAVKEYVSQKYGKEMVCPLLGTWDSFDEINFDLLPDQFVLKTNHCGGNLGVVICDDKSKFDIQKARENINEALHTDVYPLYREWPYKNVKKKIFAEQYLGDDLVDYKFYCFTGNADYVLVCTDRQKGDVKYYFFDCDWHLRRYSKDGQEAPEGFTLPKPDNIEELFKMATIMSKGFPFVRVDFYDIHGKVIFGEYTFFPASGFKIDLPPEIDKLFGDKIDLSLAH